HKLKFCVLQKKLHHYINSHFVIILQTIKKEENCRKMSGLINIWTTEFSKLLKRESISAKGSNPKSELIGEKYEIKKLPILQNYYCSDASISMIVHCVSP
ncbi:hypothetical protein AABB24_036314, partial [Solanum stoloniferum]